MAVNKQQGNGKGYVLEHLGCLDVGNSDDAINLACAKCFDCLGDLRGAFTTAGDDGGITSLISFILDGGSHGREEWVDQARNHNADGVSAGALQSSCLRIGAVVELFSGFLDELSGLFSNGRVISQSAGDRGNRDVAGACDVSQRGRSSHHVRLLCVK